MKGARQNGLMWWGWRWIRDEYIDFFMVWLDHNSYILFYTLASYHSLRDFAHSLFHKSIHKYLYLIPQVHVRFITGIHVTWLVCLSAVSSCCFCTIYSLFSVSWLSEEDKNFPNTLWKSRPPWHPCLCNVGSTYGVSLWDTLYFCGKTENTDARVWKQQLALLVVRTVVFFSPSFLLSHSLL